MIKNIIFLLFGLLILLTSMSIFIIGNSSDHLNELRYFWYMPVPFGLLAMMIGALGLIRRSKEKK